MRRRTKHQFVAYRLKNGAKLWGFGDPIGETPVLEMSLAEWQNKAFSDHGIEVKDIDVSMPPRQTYVAIEDSTNIFSQLPAQAFIFDEDLFFTSEFIGACLLEAQSSNEKNFRFTLNANRFNERYVLPTEKGSKSPGPFNFFYKGALKAPIEEKAIAQQTFSFEVNLPSQIVPGGCYSSDSTDVILARIASPFHLLQVNLAANIARSVPMRRKVPRWLESRLTTMGSKHFFRGIKRLNKIGKNCRIHPTALIEGSVLGDNVTVGAYSVVRLSHLAADTTIEEHCTVKYSVLGAKTYVSQSNQIHSSLTYPEAYLIHGPYQFSVFGRNTAVMAVINCDYRLDQKTISISTDRGIIDSGQHLFGVAYGHRSKVGGGNIIAPGRIVPNDYHCAPPNFIRMRFDEPTL